MEIPSGGSQWLPETLLLGFGHEYVGCKPMGRRLQTDIDIRVFPKIGFFPPKWMVKIMETPMKMDDFGGKTHYFGKHPYYEE